MGAMNFCPSCGAPLEPDAHFCGVCRHNLSAPSVPPIDAMQAAMDAAPKVVDDPRMYATVPPPPGGWEAQLEAEAESRRQGVTHDQAQFAEVPPPPPDGLSDAQREGTQLFNEMPKPATPPAKAMPMATRLAYMAAVVLGGGALSLGIIHFAGPSNSDQTATSGVSVVTGALQSFQPPA